ncbi:MAG: hypothetical protein ACI865_002028 [Flavobacteriaceae bacterium]|jgi:hypothetical protein
MLKCNTMRHQLNNLTLFVMLLFLPTLIFSQTPLPLGLISTFEAYTGIGAVTNSGTFTGDVGTDGGALTGFGGPPFFIGTAYNSDATTAQARADMLWMYINLNNLPVTDFTHLAAFGGGESLTPGVYSIASAGTLGGTITLNGGVNDFFIFKFEGAFTAGAGSTVVLAGGVRADNVFWIANGAITITPTLVSAPTTIKGTLFSYPGAITLGANCDIEGRLLGTDGAITTGINSVATMPSGVCDIPIPCLNTCNPVHDVLGTIGNFIFFTNNGAVTNVSTSGIVGTVGADIGSISGFGSSTHVGGFHLGPINPITNQAALDLNNAYTLLTAIPATPGPAHGAAFGLPTKPGEILAPGVYDIATAASLTGFITLDGGGDPNAVFIIRVNGAFSVASRARVLLANGTRVCNVFWIATGVDAIDMGTWSFVRGVVMAGGACTMASSGTIEGRMLSRNGAVGFSTGTAYNEPLCTIPVLPIELLSFTASVQNTDVELNWITASENNNDYFTIERSTDALNFTSISTLSGAGNSAEMISYSTVDDRPFTGVSYYRLEQTDYDGETSYSNIVAVELNEYSLAIYPNPFSDETTFQTAEKLNGAKLTVYNSCGRVVKQLKNISGQTFTLAREDLSGGLYFISLEQDGEILATDKLVVTY